jgi:hypothetical protein
MNFDALVGLREINPVTLGAITIKFFPLAFDQAEPLGVELVQIFG